jgi:hypothetical protein
MADYAGVRHEDGSYTLLWVFEGELKAENYRAGTTPEIDRLVWLRDVSLPLKGEGNGREDPGGHPG